MKRQLILLAAVTPMLACGGNRTYRFQALGPGQGLTRITSDKADERAPSISPDGKLLLFETRGTGNSAIVGVDPNSGAKRTLYTSSTSLASEATWDPKGRYFVYSSNSAGAWSLVRSVSSSPNAAVSIVVNGEMAPLASDPSLDPAGSRVAFATRIRGVWNIAIANIDGSNFTVMGEGSAPSFSPDGKLLAFSRASNGRVQVFTMNAETATEVTQVTSGEHDNFSPKWSPDGDYMVFVSNRSAKRARKIYNAKSGTYAGLTMRNATEFNLFATRPDGAGVVQLTSGDAMNVDPIWGKDGWIYFASNQSGNFDIWRLRPTGELIGKK